MDLKETATTLAARLDRLAFTVAQVVHLLDVAFWASLSTDEGRETRCVLAIPREEWRPDASWYQLLLDSPLALTTESIRKLAPATDPASGGLVISMIGGAPMITGFFSRPVQGTDFPGAEVAIRGPGALLIRQEGRELLQIAQGRASWFLLGANESSLGGLIAGVATTMETATVSRVTRAMVLTRIARRIALAGHGGALFVVPRKVEVAGIVAPPQFPVRDANVLRIALRRVYSSRRQRSKASRELAVATTQPFAQQLEGTMALVASLALVDGALVVDDGLKVRSFGTFVKLSETLPEVVDAVEIQGPVVATRGALTAEIGGARHRSALSFCLGQPSWAVAFVASQDGRASAFIKDMNGVVRMFRPISFHARHNSLF